MYQILKHWKFSLQKITEPLYQRFFSRISSNPWQVQHVHLPCNSIVDRTVKNEIVFKKLWTMSFNICLITNKWNKLTPQMNCHGSSTLSVQGFGFHHESVHMYWFVSQWDKIFETLNIALWQFIFCFLKLHHYSKEVSLILAIFFHECCVKLVPCFIHYTSCTCW